jgi:hypothetical protein
MDTISTFDTVQSADTTHLPRHADRFIQSAHDTTWVHQSLPFVEKPSTPSFLKHHLLKPASQGPRIIHRQQTDWILGTLIVWVCVIAWVRFFYGKRFKLLLQAPFSRRSQNQLLREGDLFSERISVAVGFIYFIGMSLLIFQVYNHLFDDSLPARFTGFTFYLFILAILLAYWFVKVIMMLLLSSVFRTRPTTQEYLINIIVINAITGIVLLPAMVLNIYLQSDRVLFITLGIIGLLFLFRFIKGFLTGLSLTKFSYIFLFVYLCTLEIVPLILVVKLSIIYYISKVPFH